MNKCIVCEEIVDDSQRLDQFKALLERVDIYGVVSLTEKEQAVYEGLICSKNCYYKLN